MRPSLTAVTLLLAAGTASADGPKWNLLLVTADDMNADSAGWLGNKLGATPHLPVVARTRHPQHLTRSHHADHRRQLSHTRHQERSSLGWLGSTSPSRNETFFWMSITASAATTGISS